MNRLRSRSETDGNRPSRRGSRGSITRLALAAAALLCSVSAWAGQPLFTGVADLRGKPAASVAASNAAKRPENMSVRTMRANPDVVSPQTSEIELDLGHKRVNAVFDSAQTNPDGSMVWIGHVRETSKFRAMTAREVRRDEMNSVVLVRSGSGITGTVFVSGQLYRIQPLSGNDHAVIQVREDALPQEHPNGPLPEGGGAPTSARSPAMTATVVSPGATTTIRVLVLATNTAIATYGGDMRAMANTAIAESNQGFINSNAGIRFELAGYSAVTCTEAGMSTDLSRLSGTSDGYLDNIHALRDSSAADVVVLVENEPSYCGLGYLNAGPGSAFAVVHWSCMTGYYSFAHEIGHIIGARHDPATDPTTTPYAYGHGYRAPNNAWRSIMAYDCTPSCPRLNYWSNPDVTYGGVAMGTASTSHNQRVLVENKARVAAFRSTPAPPAATLAKAVPVTGLSAATNGELKYAFTVPAGATNLTFRLYGGTGDADLHVKFGSAPTATLFDCRPYLAGNNETCTFATAQAGTYYVMVKAYSAFSGASLVADYAAAPSAVTYSNTVRYNITDNATIESPIVVSGRSGNASASTPVTIDIIHTYQGDLKVDLVAPNGTQYNLHNRTGASTDNIRKTVTLNLSAHPLNGTWKLRVYDGAAGDIGYLQSWSIRF